MRKGAPESPGLGGFGGPHVQCFLRDRGGQQIMGIQAVDACPAQVIGNPHRVNTIGQGFEFPQVVLVQRVGGAQIHRHPMHGNRVLLREPVQVVERFTPATR